MKHTKYRSKFELEVAKQIKALGSPVLYEKVVLHYTVPATSHIYHPDFVVGFKPLTAIEVKGRLTQKDRAKLLRVKADNPGAKIYILFQNANNKLYRGSPTTYGEWATKNGFEWSHKRIKKEWWKNYERIHSYTKRRRQRKGRNYTDS